MFACTDDDFFSLLLELPFWSPFAKKKKRPQLVEIMDLTADYNVDFGEVAQVPYNQPSLAKCSHYWLAASFDSSCTTSYTDEEGDTFSDDGEEEEEEEDGIIGAGSDDSWKRSIFTIDEEETNGKTYDENASLSTGPLLHDVHGQSQESASFHVSSSHHDSTVVDRDNHKDQMEVEKHRDDDNVSDDERVDNFIEEEEEDAMISDGEISLLPLASSHALIQPELMHHLVKVANVGGGQMGEGASSTVSFDDEYGYENEGREEAAVLFILSADQVNWDDETTLTDVTSRSI